MEEYFEIGQIVNTSGLKGEIKIKPFTDDITNNTCHDGRHYCCSVTRLLSGNKYNVLYKYWKQQL